MKHFGTRVSQLLGESTRAWSLQVLLAFALLLWVCLLWGITPETLATVPMRYDRDSFLALSNAQALLRGTFFGREQALGFPFGVFFSDFPASDFAHLAQLWILSKLTQDPVLAVNLCWLSSIPIVYLLGVYVFGLTGVSGYFPKVLAAAFACLYFHFYRGTHHLFLANYFYVPLLFCLLIEVLIQGRRFSWVRHGLMVLAICGSGVYPFVFSAVTLALGWLYFRREWASGMKVGVAMVFGGSVGMLPTLIAAARQQGAVGKIPRMGFDIEIYGSKLIHWLLPNGDHFVRFMAKPIHKYLQLTPNNHEGMGGSLGLFLGLALLWLIKSHFTESEQSRDPVRGFWARVAAFWILATSMGSLGSLVMLFSSPMIRSMNRVSVVVAFATCLFLLKSLQDSKNRLLDMGAPLACVFALLVVADQMGHRPAWAFSTEATQRLNADRALLGRLAERGGGQAFFQLPAMRFPEAPPIGEMESYEHLRPFVAMREEPFAYSFGSFIGRRGDSSYRETAELPLELFVARLREQGFTALWLDKRAYSDKGARMIESLKSYQDGQVVEDAERVIVFLTKGARG